jgi:hypothetical protein
LGLEQKQPFVKARNSGCSTSCKRGTANRWQIDGNVVSEQAVGGLVVPSCSIRKRRKLLAHSHELPLFCLVFGGDYAEKYGHRDAQFRPFTFAYRPAGVRHQDEVG